MDRNMFQVFPFISKVFIAHLANKLGRLGGVLAVPPVMLESGGQDEAPVAVLAPVRPALVAEILMLS